MARAAIAYGGVTLLVASVTAYLGVRHAFDPVGPPQFVGPQHDVLGFLALYCAAAWLGWWVGAGSGGVLARLPVGFLGMLACWVAYCRGFVVLPPPLSPLQLLHWSTGSWLIWLAAALHSTLAMAVRRQNQPAGRVRFSFLQMMALVCGSGVVTFAVRGLVLQPEMLPVREALQSSRSTLVFGAIVLLLIAPWSWAVHSTLTLRWRVTWAGCLSCALVALVFVFAREQLLAVLRVNPAREPPIVWLELFAVTVGGFVGPALLLMCGLTGRMSALATAFFTAWQRRRLHAPRVAAAPLSA